MLVILLVLSTFTSTCEPIQRPQTQPHNLTSANLTHSCSTSTTKPVRQKRVREADLAKLEALFSHALYTLHAPSSPDDDTLLRIRTQETEEHNAQQWLSNSKEGYDPVQWNSSTETHPPWLRFHLGISRWQLYQHRDTNLPALLEQLSTHRIISAVQKTGGTQLKLVITFSNYGQALFKPMKQERYEETNVNLYYFSDFERHNAEIAAFHLDRILGFRRVPPVVGRLVDVIKEIKDITSDHKLARTFFNSPVGNSCFYGQCSYYCSTEHAVCGRPRALEGSLAAMLPDLSLSPRRSWRNPWRRSYSRSKLALFGRYSKDEPSILTPLVQCCRIRRSTLLRLHLLSSPQYRLSDVMRASLSQDPLAAVAPLLTEPHLSALDRRLAAVLQSVQRCLLQHQHHHDVIYDDITDYSG
ncbi:hypothetical protein PHYPO_G00148050 [Pangasianodon hypophthalmus]|uniref:FAM20 C-terminal domain-containing protein n=1 Tax=Pangasianodon hypophthalmus TaxID=310915 RepID=A0A5N5K5D3_PANHP|nr:hypothetical protein PHYPO_G00148050 [Pangasianodon hypophthalmus]